MAVLTFLSIHLFLRRVSSLKIHLNLPKLILHFINYLSSKFDAVDDIMTKVRDKIREGKIDLNTRKTSRRSYAQESANIGLGDRLDDG